MDPQQFDALSRTFAYASSRRQAMARAGAAGLLAGLASAFGRGRSEALPAVQGETCRLRHSSPPYAPVPILRSACKLTSRANCEARSILPSVRMEPSRRVAFFLMVVQRCRLLDRLLAAPSICGPT